MKIILSRKGFDCTNGRCASPIMPDGTMLSLPIPSEDDLLFSDCAYNGLGYDTIVKQLQPKYEYINCHLDPDIRPGVRKKSAKNWEPAFGQCDTAQAYLSNCGVGEGDLFLFFGRFRAVEYKENKLRYIKGSHAEDFYKSSDLHVIFGYLQVGKVLTEEESIRAYPWHPHSKNSGLKNNAIYIPTARLSFDSSLPGYGVFNFSKSLVLTKEGCSMAVWNENPVYLPDAIYANRRNSAKNGGLFYKGIWQEIVLKETPDAENWAKSIILDRIESK